MDESTMGSMLPMNYGRFNRLCAKQQQLLRYRRRDITNGLWSIRDELAYTAEMANLDIAIDRLGVI